MAQTFDIYFAGQLAEGRSVAEVKKTIGRQFKLQGAQLDQLFGGPPVAVKKGVDANTASQYQNAFRKAGAIIEIRPSDTATAPSSTPSIPTASKATVAPGEAAMSLLPANTGSLIDCAREVEPVAIDDIAASLAPAGSDLDDTPDKPAPNIDISGLSLAPDPE